LRRRSHRCLTPRFRSCRHACRWAIATCGDERRLDESSLLV
jgi:hypothetical protein